ncbi:MAG: RagB/SusD family nutrient uptake outer membrane protein [Bacteroidales bacterium]|nr:RagB/SusD family nutrient uptake outer membrane protein [Bacteroidales bacterium]
MIMKKIFYAICAFAVLMLSSCGKDFVTAVHNSSEPQSEYYINEERMFQGLVAAYDPLKWFDYFYEYDALNMVSDIMADDIYCGGSNEGDQPKLVKTHFYNVTSLEQCGAIWTICYSGINRACHVLENVDGVPGMTEEKKNLYKAEATVLKAFYYTLLWKFWGNVPYYDKNLEAPYIAPQLKADEVYENIVTRLEEAFELNVLPMKAAAGNEGRVTKAMAYMLYAEAVMYQNDQARYAKALEFMDEIITSGKYSLVSDFASIWEESGEWGTESVWEINYMSEGAARSWGNPIYSGGSVYPMLSGVPGAPEASGYKGGWGFGPVAQSAWDMYEEGDTRRDGGILNFYYEFPDLTLGETRWQYTGLFLKKYVARMNGNHGQIADADMNYGNNQRYYRYAETLLNAAELGVLTGKDRSNCLAEVRARANCSDTGTDQLSILEERHKEFVGEGKRYWDLIRTGQAATVLKAANHEWRQNDWTENKKYWPLPQSECDKDPNLVQNNY